MRIDLKDQIVFKLRRDSAVKDMIRLDLLAIVCLQTCSENNSHTDTLTSTQTHVHTRTHTGA